MFDEPKKNENRKPCGRRVDRLGGLLFDAIESGHYAWIAFVMLVIWPIDWVIATRLPWLGLGLAMTQLPMVIEWLWHQSKLTWQRLATSIS